MRSEFSPARSFTGLGLFVLSLLFSSPLRAQLPELIYSDESATALAINETHLFAAFNGNSPETCALVETLNPIIARIALDDVTDVQILYVACTAAISSMVADSQYVYYRNSDATIRRLSTEPPGTPVVLSDESSSSSAARIAIDDDHVYWAGASGGTNTIYRVPKTGGADEILVSFSDDDHLIRQLVVDGPHVYWAEGRIGSGAIKRIPKAGGAIDALVGPGDGLDNTWTLAVDQAHVFFGGVSSGRVRRVPKNGGATLELLSGLDTEEEVAYIEGYMVESIGATQNYVIWSDTQGGFDGRIRRIDKGAGAVADPSVTQLQQFALGARNVVFSSTHVYWSQFGEIYRQEVDAAGVAGDLVAARIEVTQGLSTVSESIEFAPRKVAGKPTCSIR